MNSSSETINSGQKGNKTGKTLELFVERLLQDNGYEEFWDHKAQMFENRKSIGGKQYAKQVPCGMSIYETPRKCDFLVINKEKFPDDLIIECKWQQARGTTHEKYPFAFFNITKIGVPTIILLDGGGYSSASAKWFRSVVDQNRALIGVYSMAELQAKVNNGFLG